MQSDSRKELAERKKEIKVEEREVLGERAQSQVSEEIEKYKKLKSESLTLMKEEITKQF